MAAKFVVVHRSYDPILIEHLGEMLRESGVVARVIGTRDAAIIGIGQSINELHISVPEEQAGEATDFLEAFFAEDGEELLAREGIGEDEDGEDEDDEDDGDDDDSEVDESERPLSHALAGVAVLFCGLGHVYARQRVTGAILAASFVGGFIVAPIFVRLSETGWTAVGLFCLGVLACDFVGAQLAVRSHNRGRRAGLARQLAIAALYVCIALAVSALSRVGKRLDTAFPPPWLFGELSRQLEGSNDPFETYSPDDVLDPFEIFVPSLPTY